MSNRFLPFVLLALAVAIIFFYIRPAFGTTISGLQNQITVDDQALAAADRFSSREADLTSQRDAIPADELERLEAYVPDNVDTVRVVIDLNALAARTGVTLSNFAVDTTNSTPADASAGSAPLSSSSLTDSVDLTFTATGTYSAFRSFLGGVETSLRPYDAMNIGVKDSATGVYTYTLTLRTYALQ